MRIVDACVSVCTKRSVFELENVFHFAGFFFFRAQKSLFDGGVVTCFSFLGFFQNPSSKTQSLNLDRAFRSFETDFDDFIFFQKSFL